VILLWILLVPLLAGAPAGTITVGSQVFPGQGGLIHPGTSARAAILAPVGRLHLGGAFHGALHRACGYQEQVDGDCEGNPAAAVLPGSFLLVGVGPTAALPSLWEVGPLQLGAHSDVLVERFYVPMDEESYQELVVDSAWAGSEPLVDTRAWLLRPGLGLDLGWSLLPEGAGPELVVSAEAAWHSRLGFSATGMAGLRVSGD
jgi:hypothetical protein